MLNNVLGFITKAVEIFAFFERLVNTARGPRIQNANQGTNDETSRGLIENAAECGGDAGVCKDSLHPQ